MLGFEDNPEEGREVTARDPLRIVRPEGFESYGAFKWTHSEDVVVRSPKMPNLGGSLSQQDVEHIMCLMCVPYIRVPLILRFIARRGASAICSSHVVRSLIEHLLYQPREFFDPKVAAARGATLYTSARQAAADLRDARPGSTSSSSAVARALSQARAMASSSGAASSGAGRNDQEPEVPYVPGSEEV